MLTIGLTGGIGCGKSTVAAMFAELHVPIIDADVIAHQIVEPGHEILAQIFQQFGPELKCADGSLDRDTLRARVFDDPASRQRLESIMHPVIREEMQHQLQNIDADYCILVIPLLIESGQQDSCDRILVIDCTENTQRKRVLQRAGLTETQFDAILRAQCSRQQRLADADDIISNDSNDMDSLRQQVLVLHQQYVKMSKNV